MQVSNGLSGFDLIRMHSIGDVLREHRRSRPQLTAVVDGDVRLTWPELDSRVNRLANALRRAGVTQGERVLWLGQNSHRLLEGLLAAARLGAIFCPANWRLGPQEVAFVIDDFAPQVILWQAQEVGPLVEAAKELASHSCLWVQHDGEDATGYESWIAGEDDRDDEQPVNAELPLLAVYTAAFDGKPNAALLPHSAILYQSLMIAYAESIRESSVFLNSGPLFHLGTMLSTLATFHFGGVNAFVPRIDAERMLQVIEQEKVTHTFVPQPTIEQIREINKDGKYDTSSLWSAPSAPEWRNPLVMPVNAPLNGKPFLYGQTEIMGFAVMGWLGGQGAGRPSPLCQVRILDDQGQELEPGMVGEIAVRGPQVMAGYFNRAEENGRRTADGWYRTRDLGKRLEDGSIVFVGPKTVMIKSGVENIYPAEVEACLRQHPAVADVCVIGVPDPTWQQNVKALVVLKPGESVSANILIDHCRPLIASYKKPKVVEFIDQLPRTSEGMVDRARADELYGGGGYPCSA